MEKRELSSTLKNLKFMQRASLREEKTKEEDEVKSDPNFPTTSTNSRKCLVVMEGDPHPGAIKGRMSFQNFNPSVEKLTAEEERLGQSAAEPETCISRNQSGNMSFRENSSSVEGPGCSNLDNKSYEVNGNAKRKQGEVICEAQYPNKSPRNDQGNRQSCPDNSLVSFKKLRGDKLDWNVLRLSKCQTNRLGILFIFQKKLRVHLGER